MSAATVPVTARPEVLLIDLSSLFWTAAHAVDSYPEAASIAASSVRRAVGMCESPLVVVCTDEGKSFRKTMAPSYKAQREAKPASAYAALDKLKDSLRADAFLVVGVDGFEADDVIATFAVKASAAGHPVCIASSDKDLLQLLRLPDSRQIRTYNAWDVWRSAEVVAKFGLEPEGLTDWLALVGDASDNVPGVPSIGPKTATALLLKHFSLAELYAKIDGLGVMGEAGDAKRCCETMTPKAKEIGTPAVVEKLWRHKADAFLARQLVELRTDAPVNFDDLYAERTVMTTKNSKTTNLDDDGDIISKPPAQEDVKPRPTTGTSAPAATEATAPVPETTTTTPSIDSVPAAAATTTSSTVTETRPVADLVVMPIYAEYTHGLEPRTASQALTLGEVLFESRAYRRFPTAQAITATIMRGRELGFPALASLDAFHWVADLERILPSWQVLVTLAEKDENCEWFRWVGGDDKSQTWETKHRKHKDVTRLTYTYAQAEKTGLVKPDKPRSAWMARPDEMLRKTAACQLARAVYSGATLGLYSSAEMGGEE